MWRLELAHSARSVEKKLSFSPTLIFPPRIALFEQDHNDKYLARKGANWRDVKAGHTLAAVKFFSCHLRPNVFALLSLSLSLSFFFSLSLSLSLSIYLSLCAFLYRWRKTQSSGNVYSKVSLDAVL
jgi:hypothetical protein